MCRSFTVHKCKFHVLIGQIREPDRLGEVNNHVLHSLGNYSNRSHGRSCRQRFVFLGIHGVVSVSNVYRVFDGKSGNVLRFDLVNHVAFHFALSLIVLPGFRPYPLHFRRNISYGGTVGQLAVPFAIFRGILCLAVEVGIRQTVLQLHKVIRHHRCLIRLQCGGAGQRNCDRIIDQFASTGHHALGIRTEICFLAVRGKNTHNVFSYRKERIGLDRNYR